MSCDLEVTNERTLCGGGNFSFTASSLSVVMVGDFFSFVLYVYCEPRSEGKQKKCAASVLSEEATFRKPEHCVKKRLRLAGIMLSRL